MSASPSDAPQFEAAQFHPEFGYLAPTMRYRRKVTLALKGALLGALAGAVAMFVVTMEREEEKALAMLATPVLVPPPASKPAQAAMPTRTAAIDIFAPVPFVPESIALPTTSRTPRAGRVAAPSVAATASGPMPSAPSTVGASPAASAAVAMPAPAPAPAAKAVAKPKKKVVREPHPDRTARPYPPEPDPRAAFAGPPPRRFGLPIFGFGW